MRKKLLTPLIVSAAFMVAPAMAQANTTPITSTTAPAAAPAGEVIPLWTHQAAEEVALDYAAEHWGNGPRLYGCYNTGKEKAEEIQWECEGWFEGGPNIWIVDIGPYGKVLYAKKS